MLHLFSNKSYLKNNFFSCKPFLPKATLSSFVVNKHINLKKKKSFFKFDQVVCKKVRWVYNSKSYRNILSLRNRVHQYYDGVFKNRFFKKQLQNKFFFLDFIRYSFIKPEFRLDIILWRLNFFSSPYSARIAILNNEVIVNGSSVWFSYYLKEGDVVVLKKVKNLKFLRSLKIMKYSLNSFIEIDYYSNSFIVLQDYTSVSVETLPCTIRQPFKASSHFSYLRLK